MGRKRKNIEQEEKEDGHKILTESITQVHSQIHLKTKKLKLKAKHKI